MADLMELTCPNCGAKLETDKSAAQVQCAHCGTELVIERKAMAVAADVGREKCPKCGKTDRVQKASSVYTSGISRGYYDGYWGHSQTDLSMLLARPSAPSSTDLIGVIFVAIGAMLLLFFGGMSLLFLWGASNALQQGSCGGAAIAVGLAAAIVCPCLAFVVYGRMRGGRQRRQYAIEKPRWDRAVHRWERLYYCARDDGVFIPGETPFIPIDNMQEFLYAD